MKKKIYILAVGLILCLSGAFVLERHVRANNHYDSSSTSEEAKELYKLSHEEGKIDGFTDAYDPENIDERIIEKQAQAVADQTGEDEEKVEKRMRDDAEETRALYLAAKDAGYEVDPDEVDKLIEELKKGISQDKEASENLKAIIAGLGVSEDEYWESVRPKYEANMIINKYTDAELKKHAEKEGKTMNPGMDQSVRKKWESQIVKDALKRYGSND